LRHTAAVNEAHQNATAFDIESALASRCIPLAIVDDELKADWRVDLEFF
jgi:hypothetical protein